MFRGDPAHTGRSTATGPELPSLEWRYELATSSYSSPALGPSGQVYVASDEALLALSAEGTERWSYPLDDFTIGSPAVGPDGLVYVGSTAGTVYAIEGTSGIVRWTATMEGGLWASPLLLPSGLLVVATESGTVHALQAQNGEELWRMDGFDRFFSTPAYLDGLLFAIDYEGRGRVIDSESGAARASFSVPARVISSPAVASGRLYVGGLDGSLYAIDPFTDDVRWSTSLGSEVVSSPAVGSDGVIYAGSVDEEVHALRSEDGTRAWSAPLQGSVYSSPLLDAAGRLYVGTADTTLQSGQVVALATSDGALQWSLPAAGPVWASPALDADGELLVASNGTLNAAGELLRIEPAAMQVDPGDDPVAEGEYVVGVSALDPFQPTSGTLFYRQGGARSYQTLQLVPGGQPPDFEATIPAASVTLRGLEFYVELTDGESTRTLPASRPAERPLVRRVYVEQAEAPLTFSPGQYGMISVPAELTGRAIDELLADDFGEPDEMIWRLFRWNAAAERYDEHPEARFSVDPASAFFLVHRRGAPFTIEEARSVDTSRPYVVTLQPGWNQVGVPFAFPVERDAVTVIEGPENALSEFAFFDGEEMIQDAAFFAQLQPWQGYFVHNPTDQPIRIAFRPDEAAALSGKRVASTEGDPFTLQLSARTTDGHYRDTQNWISLAPTAVGRLAREAPVPGGHLRLSIVDEQRRYAAHARMTAGGEGAAWELELEQMPAPRTPQEVEIDLIPTGDMPADFEMHLVDADAGRRLPLIGGSVRVQVGGERPLRQLRLIIGSRAFAAAELEGTAPAEPILSLDQNVPNPFATSTSISFQMDRPSRVQIDLFNMLGQRVMTLAEGRYDAGEHTVTWDGAVPDGRSLASGVYIYRLKAGSHTISRKMILIR